MGTAGSAAPVPTQRGIAGTGLNAWAGNSVKRGMKRHPSGPRLQKEPLEIDLLSLPSWFILNFGSSPNWFVIVASLLVARAKEQAPKTKRAGSNLLMSILLSLRKETRRERNHRADNGGSPPWEKREPCLFWRGECSFARAGNQSARRGIFHSQSSLKIPIT